MIDPSAALKELIPRIIGLYLLVLFNVGLN